MNLPGVILPALLLITGLVLLVRLVIAIRRNYQTGQSFRDKLADRISELRLAKMLMARNIDLSAYLHTRNITEIEQTLRSCQSCNVKTTCDEELENENRSSFDGGFCPNDDLLKKTSDQIKSS